MIDDALGPPRPCRLCGSPLEHTFADLGMTPLANSLLERDALDRMEPFYPLRVFVCDRCLLVQLPEHASPATIFSDYAYFSSYSTTWLEHARRFAAEAIERFGLSAASRVVEVASNDGYLLRHFRDAGVPAIGVEPAANVARVAIEQDLPTVVDFFGSRLARELAAAGPADLVVANNVLPHTPTVADMLAGVATLLAPDGVLSAEFPHLACLIKQTEFDTIYHEHYSYFSLLTFERALRPHGLAVFDVERLPTHGGSLRVLAGRAGGPRAPEPSVEEVRELERAAGLDRLDTHLAFAEQVRAAKRDVAEFFIGLRREGLSVAGYGAPAKANTLLNCCGLGRDFVDFTVDRNPHKQGRFLPGTHIPVRPPEAIDAARPDVVFVFPWNLQEEIREQLRHIRDWGGRFAVHAPRPRLLD